MFRLFTLLSFVALSASQGYQHDSKNAAIISEQRYLSGDGKFGAAYSQEDGINFKEETDADGTRHGSYSYVDPTGQRRTISYTAGKNGFQASGDHLPVAPPAPPQVAPASGYTPQAQYQPQQYQAPQQPQHAYRSNDGSENYDDGSYDARYNDPSFSEQQRPYQAPAPQAPAYNPAPAYSPPAPAPQYQHYSQPQQQAAYYPDPTQSPHRFSPPGKLSLNRTPDGFTYSFNKV